jgi:hypothetical protein
MVHRVHPPGSVGGGGSSSGSGGGSGGGSSDDVCRFPPREQKRECAESRKFRVGGGGGGSGAGTRTRLLGGSPAVAAACGCGSGGGCSFCVGESRRSPRQPAVRRRHTLTVVLAALRAVTVTVT